jgi:hypothetical protein
VHRRVDAPLTEERIVQGPPLHFAQISRLRLLRLTKLIETSSRDVPVLLQRDPELVRRLVHGMALAIMGQNLKRADSLGVWYLHVWIWEPNPSGLFADWNPLVKC